MRVISGSARGRRLQPPADNRIRPTSDRVKEALFSTLTSRFGSLEGTVILDLFSGSGSLGIEALSRGAEHVVFVDSHPESINLTRKNLELTGFVNSADLLKLDSLNALQYLSRKGVLFDILLIDPPYTDKKLTENIISLAAGLSIINEGGVMVLESASKLELNLPEALQLSARKVYGDTAIWIFDQEYCFSADPKPVPPLK